MENTEKQNVGKWFVFGEYKVEKLMDGLYALDDGKDSSFYVLEGSQKAAVIDTGMGDGDVMPVIRQVTSLPCELLITHAHGDHMMHSGEFEKRYMSSKDIPVVLEFVKSMGMDPVLGTLEYTAFDPGAVLDLGNGVTLECVAMYGHTPGSVGYYCQKYNIIFSGDAFGSGMGVWMQVPYAVCVSEYKKNLEAFLAWAQDKDPSMEFLTGHRSQRYGFGDMEQDNPVRLDMIRDMVVLCQKLLDKEMTGTIMDAPISFGEEKAMTASYGRAGMVFLPSGVK